MPPAPNDTPGDNNVEVHEMDTIPHDQLEGDLSDRTPLKPRKLAQDLSNRDYAIGIVLLLCVVLLWTASNFVTQVSLPTLLQYSISNTTRS